MDWDIMGKKIKYCGIKKGKIKLFASLLLIASLYVAKPSQAQQAVIEGSVVLEQQHSSNKINLDGYQSIPKGSSFNNKDSLSNEIIIWLEAKNKSIARDLVSKFSERRVLDQENKHFKPRIMVVKVGEKVRIHNSDPVYHNVFSLSKTKRFDVGRRSPGNYKDVKFDKAGKVDVFCDIHSDMHAVIWVTPKQTVAMKKIQSGEEFLLSDISEGKYVLQLYALGVQRKKINIEIADDKKITLQTIRLGS